METDADEFAQSDADASAKIAYVGIIKSTDALELIYNWNEDPQDSVLTLLVEIDKLRRGIDREFPNHRTFKRPGFD